MDIRGKRILITGVTGTLGEKVAISFVEKAKEVRGLVRDNSREDRLKGLGITPVIGELTDRNSLQQILKKIDLIVHCAAYLGDDREKAIESNVTGVENLASASLENRVQKFVHISSLSVYGEPTEGNIDERTPIVDHHDEAYIETKAKSEQLLMNYIKKGLNVIILRPGAICAEENSYWGDRQIFRMMNTDVVDWVHPDDRIAWIHTDNLVNLIHLVIEKASSGDVFNAIDGNFPEKDFRVRLIEILGKKLKAPNRIVERPIYSNQKIKDLGYISNKSFEQTMQNLEKLAIESQSFNTLK